MSRTHGKDLNSNQDHLTPRKEHTAEKKCPILKLILPRLFELLPKASLWHCWWITGGRFPKLFCPVPDSGLRIFLFRASHTNGSGRVPAATGMKSFTPLLDLLLPKGCQRKWFVDKTLARACAPEPKWLRTPEV